MSPRTTFHMFCTAVLFATALAALPGCDIFLGCDYENFPDCAAAAPSDGQAAPIDAAVSPDMAQPSSQRAFVWATKVLLDSKTKFVGLYSNSAANFLNDSSTTSTPKWNWVQQKIDLDNPTSANRLKLQYCVTCPNLDGFDPNRDNFRMAGGIYYVLTAQGKIVRFSSATISEAIRGIDLLKPAPQPFVHPNLEALVAANQITLPGYSSATAVILPGNAISVTNFLWTSPTSFVVGDLDATDENNGYDLILFNGGTVKTVLHQKSAIPDTNLQSAIQSAIDIAKAGNETSVNAAFIGNLNHDKYIDFIISTSTTVFAISYLGRIERQGPVFVNWETPLISFSGEIVKSIMAAELTLDDYPELIVETDQAVHFYLNIPKPQ